MDTPQPLPVILRDVLAQSQSVILRHPANALTPVNRYRIYRVIASLPQYERLQKFLEFHTAQHVQPIWEQFLPQDDRMHKTLDIATQLLQGRADITTADEHIKSIWGSIELTRQPDAGIADHEQETLIVRGLSRDNGLFALMAAVTALRRIAHIEETSWEGLNIKEDDTDTTLLSSRPDTALYAAGAYAGPIWSKTSSAKKRLQFWEWWLSEAIPYAWNQATA